MPASTALRILPQQALDDARDEVECTLPHCLHCGAESDLAAKEDGGLCPRCAIHECIRDLAVLGGKSGTYDRQTCDRAIVWLAEYAEEVKP